MIHDVDWQIDAAERRAAIAAEIKMMRGPAKYKADTVAPSGLTNTQIADLVPIEFR